MTSPPNFTSTGPVTLEPFDANKRTEQYLKLRAKIKSIKARQEEELKPYKEALARLGGMLLDHLNSTNATSVKTKVGTPYISRDVSVTVADREAFWNWMLATDNFDFLEVRASEAAMNEYMEELAELSKTDPSIIPVAPPGINYTVGQKLNVKSK
jgi:hypothetical protein